MRNFLLIIFCLACTSGAKVAPPEEGGDLQGFLQNPNLVHASISLQVSDVGSGQSILSHDPQRALVPASVQKLITSGGALYRLSPDYKCTTRYYIAKQGANELYTLFIEGGSDPTSGSSILGGGKGSTIFQVVTTFLQGRGIRKLHSIVPTFSTTNTPISPPPGYAFSDIANYYGSGCRELNWNDNTFYLPITSGGSGQKITLGQANPSWPGQAFEFEGGLEVGPSGSKDEAYFYPTSNPSVLQIAGTFPPYKNAYSLKGVLPDPSYHYIVAVRVALKVVGIEVLNSPYPTRKEKLPFSKEKLCETCSIRLKEWIKPTLLKSFNLGAEAMYIASNEVDSKSLQAWLQDSLKVDLYGCTIKDGSGLSRSNALSANALTSALRAFKNGKHGELWYNMIPQNDDVATLKFGQAYPGNPDWLRAKSGHLDRVLSYAGYITAKSGKTLAFALIINNYEGASIGLKPDVEAVLKKIAREN